MHCNLVNKKKWPGRGFSSQAGTKARKVALGSEVKQAM